jgi:hypothetical protein
MNRLVKTLHPRGARTFGAGTPRPIDAVKPLIAKSRMREHGNGLL